MDFGHILKQAWQIPWQHKLILKIALVSSIPNTMIIAIMIVQLMFFFPSTSLELLVNPDVMNEPLFMQQWIEQNQQISQRINWNSLLSSPLSLLSAASLLIGAVMIVKIVQQLKSGNENLVFTEIKQLSLDIMVRVFLLNLLLYVIMMVAMVGSMVAIFIGGMVTFGLGLLCLVPLWIILLFLIRGIFTQTNIALIIEDLSITDAIKYGWELLKQNLGDLTIISILLGIISTLISMVMVMPGFIIGLFLPETSNLLKITLLVVFTLLSFVGYTLSFAFSSTGMVLTYFNLPKKPGQPAEPEQRSAQLKDISALSNVEDALEQRKGES